MKRENNMNYQTKDENIIGQQDRYIIRFREPLKFDFEENDVKVTLYQVIEGKNKSFFFNSKEEEQAFISSRTNTDSFQAATLQYLDCFANEKNVIFKQNRVYKLGPNYEFLIPYGNYAHKVLNIEKSKKKNQYVWEWRLGGLRKEYEAIYNSLKNIKKEKASKKEIDWETEELWTTND